MREMVYRLGLCWMLLVLSCSGHADDMALHVPDPARLHLLLVLDVESRSAPPELSRVLQTLLASPQLSDIRFAMSLSRDPGPAPEYRRLGDQRASVAAAITAQLELQPGEEQAAVEPLYLLVHRESASPGQDSCAEFQVLQLSASHLPGAVALSAADPVAMRRELSEALFSVVSRGGSLVSGLGPRSQGISGGASRDLYLGLFEARPRIGWRGNLKKLRLVSSARPDAQTGLQDVPAMLGEVVDSRDQAGLEQEGPMRGQISVRAVTFWTDTAALPPLSAGTEGVPGADGATVARGGAGQQIPGLAPGLDTVGDVNGVGSRQLFTERNTGSHLLPLHADLQTALELAPWLATEDPQEALALLRWARGWEEGAGPPRARDWLLGEVLHSRPLGINYGAVGPGYSRANPNIRILFGSGDGLLRVLENTDAAGEESGRELYGFIPRELLGNLRPRRDNALPAADLRYGIDGSPVALLRDRNGDGNLRVEDGDEALVYVGLRRGGSSYYALNISDPSRPPRLQWRITRTRGGDFDDLGLSFSTPVVGKVKFGGSSREVLVFGGGYRDDRASPGGSALGNAVYIVDAHSGDLVWKAVQGATGTRSNRHFAHAELGASVPAEVAALTDAGGYLHRLYVGDTGGRIWRVDLPPGHGGAADHRAEHWSISLFAELGGAGANDRRFFHAAELVQTRNGQGQAVDGILISSGNRADPAAIGVANYHFYLRDSLTTSGDPAVREREPLRLAELADRTGCGNDTLEPCDDISMQGWRVALRGPGEKGLAKPVVDAGRVFMTSFSPSTDPCARVPGQGRLYAMALTDAAALTGGRRDYALGDGIPAEMLRLDDHLLLPSGGADVPGETDGALLPCPLQRALGPRLLQIYWRQPGVDRL
ncbi:MAG: PilC/PilY family type IV pilus protein [Haliea sp.]|uniref:pilus assembly protein n=1 Tax=Haliea sp. TaxID=1932666 RepID=UPI0032EF32BB